MRSLPLLIRLARQRADERRLVLAAAEQARLAVEAALAEQDAQMAAERAQAAGDVAAMAGWADWSRAAARQRRRLLEELGVRQEREEAIRAALAEDFAALKRLELAQQAQQRNAAQAATRKAEKAAEDQELRRIR
ncbi:hypothetical protein QMO56_19835 [Roseomonas sp. E05]|uniref:hypothetical protein n=1 Tax=Roseomonas sp. E05 TaxID=3046310 RepID=UPI0024BAC6EE|nr:hypothetical protein [Roseomonas sp. E05]MDJ0390368.1 hypothetical protein [Roseomonas sp. E05]